jgi:DNA-binding NarL/FixJ family response regulator
VAREERNVRHRILIVDDEESTRLLLARMMSTDLDADVQLAGTCEQAMKLAENYAYDAILLDLLMPGVGGLAVLKDIRSAPPNAATPVIVVSVVSDERTVQQVMAAGANAYHLKPVRRAELVAAVKKQIAERRVPARH